MAEKNIDKKIIDVVDEKEIQKVDEVLEKSTEEVKEKTGWEKPFDKNAKRPRRGEKTREEIIAEWKPVTILGQKDKRKEIKDINEILDANKKIMEPEIVDALINVKSDLISIGQSKGKFGGGKRRAWRQTQRKKKEGNVATFSTMAVVGDENGHIGIGTGKSKETLPARDKAIRKAKLNLIKIKRTCAGFDCDCSEQHTVPFEVTGKSGSVRVTLIPAPQGTGLVVGSELKKILKMAGIKDVYSKTLGRNRTTFNFVKACIDALMQTTRRDVISVAPHFIPSVKKPKEEVEIPKEIKKVDSKTKFETKPEDGSAPLGVPQSTELRGKETK